jgi:hypothetical protein
VSMGKRLRRKRLSRAPPPARVILLVEKITEVIFSGIIDEVPTTIV